MPTLSEILAGGRVIPAHRPCPRVVVDDDLWQALARHLGEGRATLLGLWGGAGTVHMALLDDGAKTVAIATRECPDGHYPSVSRVHPPAIRLERTVKDLFGIEPMG